MSTLAGKRILVTGIATRESIAFATARAAQAAGASLILTAMRRDLDAAKDLAAELPEAPERVLELDATDPDDLRDLSVAVADGCDGVVHAIAFAPKNALKSVVGVDAADVELAFRTSVWTYTALADVLAKVAPEQGASLVGLHFDSQAAWPVYSWMGVCKAALVSANQYVARELGPRRIRANLVAAGPLATRAATAIPEFGALLDHWEQRSPLAWDADDASVVADAICWLLSDGSRATTGSVVQVDGGCHAVK
ncbi:MAG TPA: SDR family oxidoreductase [Acidimicrobiales bacterium]|nr:SDR family oxidoreductase [Acidimicrobiales bacterium]